MIDAVHWYHALGSLNTACPVSPREYVWSIERRFDRFHLTWLRFSRREQLRLIQTNEVTCHDRDNCHAGRRIDDRGSGLRHEQGRRVAGRARCVVVRFREPLFVGQEIGKR